MDLNIRTVFVNLESKLVVLDVNSKNGLFRLVSVYALINAGGGSHYFRYLEAFLRTSRTLALVGG